MGCQRTAGSKKSFFTSSNALWEAGDHLKGPNFVMLVRGFNTLLRSGMNFCKKPIEPIKDWSSVWEVGFGQMQIALSLSGQMA